MISVWVFIIMGRVVLWNSLCSSKDWALRHHVTLLDLIEANHGSCSHISIAPITSIVSGLPRNKYWIANCKTNCEILYLLLCVIRAEDGPTCILIRALGAGKTHFTWLLNMDVKVNLCSSCQVNLTVTLSRSLSRMIERSESTAILLELTAS